MGSHWSLVTLVVFLVLLFVFLFVILLRFVVMTRRLL